MQKAFLKTIIRGVLPKFAKFLKSQDLTEGEISSSVILSATAENKVRIDIVAMKVINDDDGTRKLAVSRILETYGEEEIID
tara:strand:- start:715 stop:957 length:243 start_codon:yes stop_codon:yes gene_type:complete